MEHIIDCAKIAGPREFHRVLAESLVFPEWYGQNLDALYDCLTSLTQETRLVFLNWDTMGIFSRGFRRVLTDAALENPHLSVTIS